MAELEKRGSTHRGDWLEDVGRRTPSVSRVEASVPPVTSPSSFGYQRHTHAPTDHSHSISAV